MMILYIFVSASILTKKNDENAEVGVLRKIRTKVYALKIILSGPISLSFFF